MIHHRLVTHPAPCCVLLSTHPARRVDTLHTDIGATWREHDPRRIAGRRNRAERETVHLGDDYDLVHAQDWLSAPGGMR